MSKRWLQILLVAWLSVLITACSTAKSASETDTSTKEKEDVTEDVSMILATTTSTQDSGLLDKLIPLFEEQTGVEVKTIAVGSGQALEMGKQGEADALLVHAPSSEEELVATEDVVNRKRVMYNDFIVIGPKEDPAGIKGLPVQEAFTKLASSQAIFVSRGDDSGTHKQELKLWDSVGGKPTSTETYVETGQGMGATLQVAAEKNGYVLTDRATFLAQEKNLTNLSILVEGDQELLNIYHVMQVNEAKHRNVQAAAAEQFVEFMTAEDTLEVIEQFGKEEYGQSLFHPYLD